MIPVYIGHDTKFGKKISLGPWKKEIKLTPEEAQQLIDRLKILLGELK